MGRPYLLIQHYKTSYIPKIHNMVEHNLEDDEADCDLPLKSLCKTCSLINIHALASPQGFKHLTVGSTLQQSAKRCPLCQYLAHYTMQAAGPHYGKDSARGCTIRLKLKRYCADAAGSSFGAVAEILFENYKPFLFTHDFFALNTVTKGEKYFTTLFNLKFPPFSTLLPLFRTSIPAHLLKSIS